MRLYCNHLWPPGKWQSPVARIVWEGFKGRLGVSQHFQGGIWIGKDGEKVFLTEEQNGQMGRGRRSLFRGTRGMAEVP